MAALRLGDTAAFPLSERKPGCSGSWTSPVSQTTGAPHAFRSALRAPLHARETRSTGPAGRGSGSGRAYGRCFARLDQVSRACGLGRRGYAPHCVTAGLGAGCHSATVCDLPAADLRLPPPFSGPLRADALPGAAGSSALVPRHALRPCRGSPTSPGYRPTTARLPACVCRGTDCCQTVRGVASVRFLTRRPASAQGRRLPPPESVAHSFGDLHPVRPGCKGRWHPVRSFIRSLRAAASVAPLLSGLPAWVSISPRAMNSGSTAESKCSPQRQAGMA